jgi:RNA polymerase sigma-70 factor, ECF subfamily
MDDSRAIRECQDGETSAFRILVERYQKQAVGHAVAILFNREDALDAVQEAFIDAFKAINSFDSARAFYPWFYVLLRNRCYKMRTRNRETESIDETEILAPQPGLRREESIGLERALGSLPPEDRELITLKYLDGLSYQELADHLQIPQGTVMSRLFYVRRQLQRKLTGSLT